MEEVDVNKSPGLYSGPGLTAPQGIGGARGMDHFGLGGMGTPEMPGGLGVRGIGKGSPGAGPAFQQHGASGGPIRVQTRPKATTGAGGTSGGGGRYSVAQAAALIRQAGGTEEEARVLGALVGQESEGNPRNANLKGEHSIGLWQINQNAHKGKFGTDEELMNPETNAKAALALYRKRGNAEDWHNTINTPRYKKDLAEAGKGAHDPDKYAYQAPNKEEKGGEPRQPGPGAPQNFKEIAGTFNAAAKHPEWGLQPGAVHTTEVTGPKGQKWQVADRAAAGFQGFVDEMAKKHPDYPLTSAGGYNNRLKRGGSTPSMHAFGTAIDINAGKNPFHGKSNDFPPDTEEIAARHGISWGKHFGDPMHFEYTGITPKFDTTQVAQQKPTPKQQVAQEKPTTTTPHSIPSYKPVAEEPKVAQTPQVEGPKQAQATPFISPPITSYQVPHKDPHGTGNRIEFASSSPPLKPDSPEQTRKFDLAASEMVNKWQQNHQGSTGRSNLQGTTGVAGSPSIYERGMGTTPGAFSTEGNPHLHRAAGSEYRHGSTDMRANPNLEIPAIYPRRGPAEGSVDFHPVPLMARGTSPGQQAHALTPSTRRDPEMSRSIPTHNQPLHEMSAGRAAAHEKAARHKPTPAAHAGTGTNHAPEASGGKHSTMPYGDAGHFDSGLRDRFLAQYLDGHG
jgi:hypothetical protein